MSNLKKYRKQIKEIKNLEKKLSTRHKKKIKKIFLEFSEKVKIDNEQKFSVDNKVVIDIDYEFLEKKVRSTLEIIYLYNLDEVLGKFKTLYNKVLSRKVIKGVRDYFLENWNKQHALKKAQKITETTRDKLNKIITVAQKEGWSYKTLVTEITTSVKDMSEYRASTIARTETATSINTVSYETSRVSGMKEKGWIHIGGKKTYRINHKALNNKWIGIDEKWDLGNGIYAMLPHADGLPASEVVRCSCLQIYR